MGVGGRERGEGREGEERDLCCDNECVLSVEKFSCGVQPNHRVRSWSILRFLFYVPRKSFLQR